MCVGMGVGKGKGVGIYICTLIYIVENWPITMKQNVTRVSGPKSVQCVTLSQLISSSKKKNMAIIPRIS